MGLDAACDVLAGLVAEAGSEAGIVTGSTLARHAAVYLAGADFPREVEMLLARVSRAGWAAEVSLDNDTFALLRAGTSAANRIAVVCGAGINCVESPQVTCCAFHRSAPSLVIGAAARRWARKRCSLRSGLRTVAGARPRYARRSCSTSARHRWWM